ncbi:nuclear transport factor 2 family protein [Actinoplanes ianthinogenes]|uniref:nuclear transport factor 2 family protein n=1 Tax=Actinoplanes ianthinogenes TaxID=122358 RepID=UPI001E413F98|nr:nuclear transport factor 2 family protein [Actinoplanes ianthinogenes]
MPAAEAAADAAPAAEAAFPGTAAAETAGGRMSVGRTPAEVVRAVTAGVGRLIAGNLSEADREAELDRLAALYAERTDVRHPLRPLGDTPLRTRAELRKHFAEGPGAARAERFEAVGEVRSTDDPEVVVYEFRYEVTVGDREFSLPCVFVTRVRDGEIVESRDYNDHIGMARAFNFLDSLAAQLT